MAGKLDFNLIGVIHFITGILAEAEVSIFVVSTYDTDYFLIQDSQYQKALEKLKSNNSINIL